MWSDKISLIWILTKGNSQYHFNFHHYYYAQYGQNVVFMYVFISLGNAESWQITFSSTAAKPAWVLLLYDATLALHRKLKITVALLLQSDVQPVLLWFVHIAEKTSTDSWAHIFNGEKL